MESIKKSNSLHFGVISKSKGALFGLMTLWLALFHSTKVNFFNIHTLPLPLIQLLDGIKRSGNVGVDVFLILSGMGAYFSMSYDSSAKRFYIRRMKRLFPSVFICSAFWFGMQEMSFAEYIVHIIPGEGIRFW